MQLHETEHATAAIFHVKGRVDTAASQELERRVLLGLDRGARYLVMDFSDLEYINSAGLRILVMGYQRLHPSGGQVMVCGVRDYIAEIFDISGYDRIFSMHADIRQAMQALEPKTDGQ